MTASEIARLRLRSQQIEPPRGGAGEGTASADPGAVVARLGAVQAQDYAAAKWAVGLRLPPGAGAATDAGIERAIAARAIVRTWPMRGTLHFVAAADVRWMLALLTPRVVAGAAARRNQLGLDDAQVGRAKEAFADALAGGRGLTREGMRDALVARGVDPDGGRAYHLLSLAAMDGLICFGPHEGKQPTFVLLDDWVPPGAGSDGTADLLADRDAALAELARRYVTGHGPATVQDLCWWSGLTAADARRGLAAAAAARDSDLVEVSGEDGRAYWMAASGGANDDGDSDGDGVHLLPGYDEYLLGYRDRSAVLDPEHAPKIVPGGNGVFQPTLVVRGRVAGLWKRGKTRTAAAASVSLEPFEPLDADAARGADEAARRYAAFLG